MKKRDEQLLQEQSIPNCREWAGAVGFEHFNRYVYTSGHQDAGLSALQRAEWLALIALVRDKLLPAVLYFQWLAEDNYRHLKKPRPRTKTKRHNSTLDSLLLYIQLFCVCV